MARLLEVKNLKTYFHTRAGTTRAVDDVSFSIDKGEIVGVVGESGSGKSVTCHTMLGLLPSPPAKVEGGAVTFDDDDETVARPVRADFGRVACRHCPAAYFSPKHKT